MSKRPFVMAQTLPWLQKCFGGSFGGLSSSFSSQKAAATYNTSLLDLKFKNAIPEMALSQHWRMNLQHTVQHLLNVSLAILHTNKRAGTRRLTPTPGLFRHCPCPYDQNQELQMWRNTLFSNMFIRICGCWKRSRLIYVNSECLCSNALQLYKEQKNIFIFTLRIN